MMRIIGLAAAISTLITAPVAASSSQWYETEGGAVRLLTTGLPDAQGRLKGTLQIRLDPGWKTYWRDPGAAGVPPTLDLANGDAVEMQYPAPQWHHDGEFDWAGYEQSISLPLTFTRNQSGPIEANVFLGICETLCVPLQAELSVDPAVDAENGMDAVQVDSAFRLLPATASDAQGVKLREASEHELLLDGALASPEAAQLFVAGSDGYQFGRPVLDMSSGKPLFKVNILARPKAAPSGSGLNYTLVTSQGAVSGLIPYF